MKTQIPLPFKPVVSYSIEGLIRVPEQSDVLKYYDHLPDLSLHGLYIYGAHHSGKTHLAHLFMHKGIQKIFTIEDALKLKNNSIALVDNISSETDLFHIMNHLLNINGKIILFSSVYLEHIQLPDLQSRLKLLNFIEIKPPQEDFMKILFFKQFSDHQLNVQDDVIDFLITRISRDYSSIHYTVEILNQKSIMHKRPITIPFAKEVLNF